MSRAQTLVLALLVINVLLGALCLVIARGDHKSPALRWWGWGLLVYAAGLLVTVASLWIPRALALTLGNSLITLAPVLCAIAILSHTRRRLDPLWTALGVAATVAVLAANNLGPAPASIVNIAAPTVIAIALFTIAGFHIVREGPREARAASHFLAGMIALSIGVWLARIAWTLALVGTTSQAAAADGVISFFAIAQMVTSIGSALSLMWIEVRLMQAELSRVAHSDALTGLLNRRGFMQRFQEEASRALRHGHRFGLAVIDLDHFKQVNDRHGHVAGDAVLRAAGQALAAAKRGEDVLARLGGEEFVILLAQPSREGAFEAAERLREAVGRASVAYGGETIRVTASGGLAMYPDDGPEWDTLFAAADRRLYAAKRAGRNRVELLDEERERAARAV